MLNNHICALDIGSSKISACVAQVKRGRINNVFFEHVPSKNIKHGVIVDSIDLVGSLTKLMNVLKAKSGINIKFVHTNISGQDIVTKHSHAIIPLAERGNKVITESDVQRVNEQARILGSSLEEEVIHLEPCSYAIDSKNNIMSPLGLYSHRLEVDLYLISAKLSSVQGLNRVMNQSGYEIKNLFFSGLVTSRLVLGKELKEGVNLFCDIGSDITELLLFKNGMLCDIEVLPIGGDSFTEKLQNELKIPFELAEDIKRSYGTIGDPKQIDEDKEILVKKERLYKPIKQRLVSEILTSSARSICSEIKNAVEKKLSTYEVNNFVTVGRATLLEGFIEMLENIVSIPVKLGRIIDPEIASAVKENSELSGQKYFIYLTALAMLSEARRDKAGFLPARRPSQNPLLKAVNRFKEVYQEYF